MSGDETIILEAGHGPCPVYRIPALHALPDGRLLLFCEGRPSLSDTGDIALVSCESVDGGKSWTTPRLILATPGMCWGNPAPMEDGRGGMLLLVSSNLAADDEASIIAGTSRDRRRAWKLHGDGQGAFSAPTDITAEVMPSDAAWFATGPGGAICLPGGRLLVPANRVPRGSSVTTDGVAYALISDDAGATWRSSAPALLCGGNEAQLARLPDGRLILRARSHAPGGPAHRMALSLDDGATWQETVQQQPTAGLVCQSALLALPDGSLLATTATALSPQRGSGYRRRSRLALSISVDAGASWSERSVVQAGPAAYSSLARLPDGTIGVAFETGLSHPYERIVFRRLPSPA